MARLESPLQTIKQAELELRQRVEEARLKSEASLQAARDQARQRIALADQEARAEADECYRQEIELARRQAEAIVVAAQEEATAIRRRATGSMDHAASRIVELVFPQSLIRK